MVRLAAGARELDQVYAIVSATSSDERTNVKNIRRILLTLAVGILAFAFVASPARAEGKIDALQVFTKLNADGIMEVASIFQGEGMGNDLQMRIPKHSALGDLRTFRFSVSDVVVTAGDADVEHTVYENSDAVTVKVDPSKANGAPLTIAYRVSGTTFTPAGQNDKRRFEWPVVGGLNLPVDKVSGKLGVLSMPPDFECSAGDPTTPHNCLVWKIDRHSPDPITFQDGPLEPGDELTLSGSQPASQLASTAKVETRWTLDRAFSLTLATALASLAVLIVGAAALWLWHRRVGRDEAATAEPTVIGEFHPIAEGVSEFRLVEKIRPGQVGTVADESVDPIDVTATILDLAVRGFLRIEQLHVPGGMDWTFTRIEKDTNDLRSYERILLDAVAPESGEPVVASEIQHAVGPVVSDMQHELYDDVVAEGWFAKHPDAARTDSRTIGAALLVVGLIATGLLAWLTTWGLVGLALVTVGVAALFVAGEMPRRSAKGAALLAGLHGFSAVLTQQRTEVMPEGREIQEISKFLPYAVVLGGKERWINAMVAADKDETPDPDAISWYRAPEDWHLQQLPQSLDALIASIQGHLFGR